MTRKLVFTEAAQAALEQLRADSARRARCKQVLKTLSLLQINLRHPSLQTHKYESLRGPRGEDIFEAYAQQHTPWAYRVFFFYGPDIITKKKRTRVLTIFAIVPHP